MKVAACSILASLALLAQAPAQGQEKDRAVAVDEVDMIVTVVEVDPSARTVVMKGPNGNLMDVAVPPESQNLDQVHPGSKFKVRYLQAVAVSLAKGGPVTSSSSRSVQMAPKGDVPGGTISTVRQMSGNVEAINHESRLVSLRGPQGRLLIFTVDDSVQGLDQVQAGDVISVEYAESVAMRMLQQ
jgi:hypothetical protein